MCYTTRRDKEKTQKNIQSTNKRIGRRRLCSMCKNMRYKKNLKACKNEYKSSGELSTYKHNHKKNRTKDVVAIIRTLNI